MAFGGQSGTHPSANTRRNVFRTKQTHAGGHEGTSHSSTRPGTGKISDRNSDCEITHLCARRHSASSLVSMALVGQRAQRREDGQSVRARILRHAVDRTVALAGFVVGRRSAESTSKMTPIRAQLCSIVLIALAGCVYAGAADAT